MSIRRCSLAFWMSLVAVSLFAGPNRWSVQGPDGGTINVIAFDPVNPTIAYAGSSNGLFRSVDGGQHWIAVAGLAGMPFTDVKVSSADPQKVYASSVYGLYKSINRGATWSQVHPFGSFAVAVGGANGEIVYSDSTGGPFRSVDGGVTFGAYGSGLPSPVAAVSRLGVDPQNPDTVYGLHQSQGVYKSVDGGAHWAAANSGLTGSSWLSLLIDPSNGATLYAGGQPGVFRTSDGGNSWSAVTSGLPAGVSGYSLAIAPGSPQTLVLGSSNGSYQSTGGGSSWTSAGLSGSTVSVIAIDPLKPANLLAAANLALLRSSNGGTSFSVSSGLTAFFVSAVALDPHSDSIVYVAGPGGLSRSADRGVSWNSLLPAASSLSVDAQNSSILFAIRSGVLNRTIDGGATWAGFGTGLPNGFPSLVVADPQVGGTIYVLYPSPAALYRKVGEGTWASRSAGLPGTVNFLAIDPNRSSTLYAGGAAGLFKSVDGGASWGSIGRPGDAGVTMSALIVDPFDSAHLLSWVSASAFESKDGGATWNGFVLPDRRQAVTLAFDPSSSGRIYVSAADFNGAATVDRSDNGGKSWFLMNAGLGKGLNTVFVVAADGNTLYGGSSHGGVWTWTYAVSRGRAVRR